MRPDQHFRGTHDSDIHEGFAKGELAEAVRQAMATWVEANPSSPLTDGIHECVMAQTAEPNRFYGGLPFEARWIAEAIGTLREDPNDRLFGHQVADAYYTSVRERAQTLSIGWLRGVLASMLATEYCTDIEHYQAGLALVHSGYKDVFSSLLATEKSPQSPDVHLAHALLQPLTEKALGALCSVARAEYGSGNRIVETASRMAMLLESARWAILYRQYIGDQKVYRSLPSWTGDIEYEGSISETIDNAFANSSGISPREFAALWLQNSLFILANPVSTSEIRLSPIFVGFQRALGLDEAADLCHESSPSHGVRIIPAGLHQCFLDDRMREILAAVESVAPLVQKPSSGSMCIPDPGIYAQELCARMEGIRWGLALPPQIIYNL